MNLNATSYYEDKQFIARIEAHVEYDQMCQPEEGPVFVDEEDFCEFPEGDENE